MPPIGRKYLFAGMVALAAASTGLFPGEEGKAIETPGPVPALSYDSTLAAPVIADDSVSEPAILASTDDPAMAGDDEAVLEPSSVPQVELECMAKVVHHEAANQSRRGQLAVAQLIVNRMKSGRFRDTICGVANQPGQFFNTAAYNPRRDTPQWAMALDVSHEALAGTTSDVVPGAMFYHAVHQPPTRWFRTRTRVATLEDHIFYR